MMETGHGTGSEVEKGQREINKMKGQEVRASGLKISKRTRLNNLGPETEDINERCQTDHRKVAGHEGKECTRGASAVSQLQCQHHIWLLV